MRAEIKQIQDMMEKADYVTDPAIATSVHLAMTLKKPLLIEGHAGVGKTEIAKVMAKMLGTNLIRLQCYEGLDASQALYEWNYPKQLLHIKLEESTAHSMSEKEAAIFSPPFLIRRPLLQAISQPGAPPVLLIDEIDRADEEFEAFLLEVLSDFQVTIPEIGTINATQPPYVILTSNRVRELSDALRRRCLYMWIDFPGFDKEVRIVTRKVPGVNERLAREISRFMETVRTIRLAKVPGVAETLDWAQALSSLHADHLDEELVAETLGCVVKDDEHVHRLTRELMDAVRALEVVDLMDRDEVYRALRTVLVSRMEEQPAFDRCFEAFWRFQAEEGQGLEGLVSMVQPTLPENEHGGNPPEAGQEKQAQIALDDWEEGEEADDE